MLLLNHTSLSQLIIYLFPFSRYIPAHAIAQSLGPAKAMALPAFHALTGCDTTSAFYGKGKKTAWSVWQSMPELTLPLQLLSSPLPTIEMIMTHTPTLQRFVMKLYGVSEDNITTVDGARLYLFLHKGRDFNHIPPSSDALHQHILRVAYQVRQLCVVELSQNINVLCVFQFDSHYVFCLLSAERACLGQYTGQGPSSSLTLSMGMAAGIPRFITHSCLHNNENHFKRLTRTCHLQMQDRL